MGWDGMGWDVEWRFYSYSTLVKSGWVEEGGRSIS